YTVEPALDSAESSSPSSVDIVLSSTGSTTYVSTFTVSSALAEITGQVTLSGSAINTGVLVLASTTTLTGGATSPPPSLSGANGLACRPCYYTVSSDASGTYSLDVRSSPSTAYQVYGWYSTMSGNTATISRKGPYAV